MADYKNYLLKRFKWVSKIYDLLCAPTKNIRKAPLKLLPIKKSTKILEVGTGTGNISIELSKHSQLVFAGDIS
ncbi:MAG: hypothetical protein DRI36_06120, partial [Caldiserica bacterium]